MYRATAFDSDVVDLLRSASFEDATEQLVVHWHDYLPTHAAALSERIAQLPTAHWETNPTLLCALGYANCNAPASNPFAALAFFDAAADVGDPPPALRVEIALGHARALRGLGRVAEARRHIDVAREALGEVGILARLELEALTHFAEGACLVFVGELETAGRQLNHGLGLAQPGQVSAARIEALGWLALVEYFTGEASTPIQLIEEIEAALPTTDPVEVAPALIVATLLAFEACDEQRARVMLDRLLLVAPGTECAAFARYLGSIELATSDTSIDGQMAKLEALQAVQLTTQGWQSPMLIRALHDDERARALLDIGSVGAARDALADVERRTALHARHSICPVYQRARIALHVGDYEAVLELTSPCRAMGDRHAPRTLARVDLLRASAHHALGDTDTAAAIFDRALLQAARSGWRRPFTDLPAKHLVDLLSAAHHRAQSPAASAVLDDLHDGVCPAPVEAPPVLSARERVILGHIAAGQTRQEISSQLSVSPNTIKAQMRSIYRKLGVSNRHEAIDRASKYGLIP